MVRLLGTGGFGRVYLAHDDDLNRSVAIKVPIASGSARRKTWTLTSKKLRSSPSSIILVIVRVYDIGRTDDGLCYVVSKFIEGSDLAARIPGQSARLLMNRRSSSPRLPRRSITPTRAALCTVTSNQRIS